MRSLLTSDGLKKGPWRPEEDLLLIKYIEAHGVGNWSSLSQNAGLKRCGKSCRLRWMNHLRPNVKHGQISPEEEDLIIRLHNLLGNRWALIAGRVPGRTDNEVKNYWNTYLSKKLALKRIEPKVHDRSHLGLVIKERLFCGDVNGEGDMKIDCADHQSSGSSDSSTLIKDTHVSADSDDSQFIPPKDLTVESVQMFLNEGYSHVAPDFPSLYSSTNYIHDFVPNSTATCNVTTPRPSTEWSKAYAASVLGKDNQAIVNSNLTKSVYSADEPCNKGNIVYDQINSDGLILNETTDQCVQPVSGSGPNLDSFWDSPFVSSRNNYNNWFELMNIPYVGTYGLGEFINDYDFVLSVE